MTTARTAPPTASAGVAVERPPVVGGRTRPRRVGRLSRGYAPKQVDAFLARVDLAFRGAQPAISAREIREAGFELVHGGYDVAQVDAVLDDLELQSAVLSAAASRRGRIDTTAETTFLRQELSGAYMQRFPRRRFPRRGYDIDDVDEFVDEVLAALDELLHPGEGRPPGAPGPTIAVVRTVAFRPKRGGYAEEAVDEALDRVVELLLLLEAQASVGPSR
jgi:DivIVA domain-containing protein